MIKGLYTSFSAMESAWKYQDILANNIANSTTAGFKRETATQQSFSDVLLSQQAPVPAPLPARIQAVVGQIGTGQFLADFSTDFTQGTLQPTGNELDLTSQQGFFQIQAPDGTQFATKDGRFGRDGNGDLVTSHGYYVLSTSGGHINLPSTAVSVAADGTISAGGAPVDQLAILDYTPDQLTRAGESYFTSATPGVQVSDGVRQGFLESSNSNLVEEMTTLLAVQRTFQANQTILAKLDSTLDIAAGQLGQVGG
jgi:flagellar basal-body rod protein FlgF